MMCAEIPDLLYLRSISQFRRRSFVAICEGCALELDAKPWRINMHLLIFLQLNPGEG